MHNTLIRIELRQHAGHEGLLDMSQVCQRDTCDATAQRIALFTVLRHAVVTSSAQAVAVFRHCLRASDRILIS